MKWPQSKTGSSNSTNSVHCRNGVPDIKVGLCGYASTVKSSAERHKWTPSKETTMKLSNIETHGLLYVCPHILVTRKALFSLLKGEVLLEAMVTDPNERVKADCECTNLVHINKTRHSNSILNKLWRRFGSFPRPITRVIRLMFAPSCLTMSLGAFFSRTRVYKALEGLEYPLCRHLKMSSLHIINSYVPCDDPVDRNLCSRGRACGCRDGQPSTRGWTTCSQDGCTLAFRFVIIHARTDDGPRITRPVESLALEHVRTYQEAATGSKDSWRHTASSFQEVLHRAMASEMERSNA